jgi:hypothetical protein
MLQHVKHKSGLIALVASVLGAGVVYLWQPITDLFVTGAYDPNVIIQVDSDSVKGDGNTPLLVVRVRAVNKGNVPATLKDEAGKGEINVEVRAIEDTAPGEWLDPNKLRSVGKKSLLSAHYGGYVVAPNSYYEEIGMIALKPGTYWIKSTLTFPDGDYVDQVHVTHHQKQ